MRHLMVQFPVRSPMAVVASYSSTEIITTGNINISIHVTLIKIGNSVRLWMMMAMLLLINIFTCRRQIKSKSIDTLVVHYTAGSIYYESCRCPGAPISNDARRIERTTWSVRLLELLYIVHVAGCDHTETGQSAAVVGETWRTTCQMDGLKESCDLLEGAIFCLG